MSTVESVYMGRREKLTYALVTLAAGLLAFQFSRLLGRILIAGGFAMFISGIIRGRERIV